MAGVLAPQLGVFQDAPAWAGVDDYNTSSEPVETVEVQLGTEDNKMVFVPSTLTFTAGR